MVLIAPLTSMQCNMIVLVLRGATQEQWSYQFVSSSWFVIVLIIKYSNPPIYRASGGKAKMHGISGDTVNRGRFNIGFIVKPDIGGTLSGTVYRGTR